MQHDTAPLSPIQTSTECLEILDKARDYVRKKVDGKFLADYSGLGSSHDYAANRRSIIKALADSDIEATKVALRLWMKLVIEYTLSRREG